MPKAVSNRVKVSATGQPILTFTDGTRVVRVSAVDTSRVKSAFLGRQGCPLPDKMESFVPQFQIDPRAG